ncbi:MAG: hypothetical protein IPK96_15670 [Flammeovirgaceae bacterium]|nr:hypothetical protein [Flammeovirgaceae bacterium]
MKFTITILVLSILFVFCSRLEAQIDKEKLSLNISKAEEANQVKLREYVWKRRSDVFIESQLKLTTITEFRYTPMANWKLKL